jgi:hypothetical protein
LFKALVANTDSRLPTVVAFDGNTIINSWDVSQSGREPVSIGNVVQLSTGVHLLDFKWTSYYTKITNATLFNIAGPGPP